MICGFLRYLKPPASLQDAKCTYGGMLLFSKDAVLYFNFAKGAKS